MGDPYTRNGSRQRRRDAQQHIRRHTIRYFLLQRQRQQHQSLIKSQRTFRHGHKLDKLQQALRHNVRWLLQYQYRYH